MQNDKEILPPREKKKTFTRIMVAAAIVCAFLGAVIFFSNPRMNFFKHSASLAVKAWNDAFGQGSYQDLSAEINMERDISASDTAFSVQSSSSSVERSKNGSGVAASSVSAEKKTSSITKKVSSAAISAADKDKNVSARNNNNNHSNDSAVLTPLPVLEKQGSVTQSNFSPSCAFPDSADSSRKIIFNEIAWMGAPSSTEKNASDASKDEWMEIKNISGSDVDLSGWYIVNSSGKIKIIFSDGDHVAANGFFLLARAVGSSSFANLQHQELYSGDLSNGGGTFAIMDSSCGVSDFLDASNGWPAGNNTTKQTLERDGNGFGWHTSVLPSGTPGLENSSGIVLSAEKTSSTPIVQYKAIIAFEGDGPGTITSVPAGMTCGPECTGMYASGTQVTLKASPGNNSIFEGWSGFCYGQLTCSFTASANVFLVASFHSTLVVPIENQGPVTSSTDPSGGGASGGGSSTSSENSLNHLVIAQVQTAGASSTNDFVKIYNSTASGVDVSGWRLRKRTQTGTEYSLRQFPQGSAIGVGKFFTWANTAGGFSDEIGADVSSTETLSSDNSVALLDASGTIIDQVAWGSGTNQYVEGSPYPTSSAPNQILERKNVNGAMVDTDNNADDFILQ